jgi:tetratricopeptide (TPR) repeat protein
LATLAFSYARLGRNQEAIAIGREAIDFARRLGAPEIIVTTLNTLGEAYHLAGDDDAAVQQHREALAVATEIGDAEERARAEEGIAKASTR